MISGSTLLAALGSVYLKKGAAKFNLNPFEQLRNRNLIAGLILFFTSAAVYTVALRVGNLSSVYPFTAMTYIWVIIVSRLMLNERVNKSKIIGIALIIAGIVILNIF